MQGAFDFAQYERHNNKKLRAYEAAYCCWAEPKNAPLERISPHCGIIYNDAHCTSSLDYLEDCPELSRAHCRYWQFMNGLAKNRSNIHECGAWGGGKTSAHKRCSCDVIKGRSYVVMPLVLNHHRQQTHMSQYFWHRHIYKAHNSLK